MGSGRSLSDLLVVGVRGRLREVGSEWGSVTCKQLLVFFSLGFCFFFFFNLGRKYEMKKCL